MVPGTFLALLLIIGIAAVYSGGIFLLTSNDSPLRKRRRRQSIERTVQRETSDLDRKFAELTRAMRNRD